MYNKNIDFLSGCFIILICIFIAAFSIGIGFTVGAGAGWLTFSGITLVLIVYVGLLIWSEIHFKK